MRERLDGWWHDVRYAARTLARQRGFAVVVAVTFALGIGANVTMFGVIDRLLLAQPPGIQAPGELGYVTISVVGSRNPPHSTLHYPLIAALREDSAVFTQVAGATEAWPDLPYVDVRPLTAMMASQLRPWKLGSQLFSLFGGLAALIAALGLYSAISYSVTRRRHEFGIRRALGAQIADVVQLVLGQGVRAAAVGIVLGLIAALGSARFVRDLLFETSPRNPAVLAAVRVTMLVVAIAATLIPAWRASRVDPVSALRAD